MEDRNVIDQGREQSANPTLDGVHSHLLVSEPFSFEFCEKVDTTAYYVSNARRDYADFSIPPAFSARVRNALNAEPKSVRLSSLVGQGGLWYGFGRMIMRL